MVSTIKVPPDGGYGWIIVLAFALSNLIILPLIQSFGLIFKDTFAEMGLSATESSLIINLNAAFGMLMGLVNGFLLKIFGYRKVAMAASFLLVVGIIATSFARTFAHFIITWGIITSLGFGLNMSAYSLAVNCFFREKKGKAVGYGMTITGLGSVFVPQLMTVLMLMYTVQDVTLLLGAIAGNGFVAASLLQPIKWHEKTVTVEEEKLDTIAEDTEMTEINERAAATKEVRDRPQVQIPVFRSVSMFESRRQRSVEATTPWDEMENAPVYGLDSPFHESMMSVNSAIRNRKPSEVSEPWKRASVQNLSRSTSVYNPEMSEPKKSEWKLFLDRLVAFFDLDLLKDPIYLNIMFGLSLAVFAEMNFSLLTPFILAEFGLNTNQIATFLSVQGISDIIFRFLAPFIGEWLKLPPRQTYMATLFLLMLTRFSLLISTNFIVLLGVALGLGVAKGFRTVYMSLVIPTYVPIEKLPSASGIQMMVNGGCILIGGPVIGFIRDVTGTYSLCIVILNAITFTTIVLWTIEGIIRRRKSKRQTTQEPVEVTDRLLTT